MCANVGVDPLSSNKGMWATLLGFGDFYYELGVQVGGGRGGAGGCWGCLGCGRCRGLWI